MANFEYPYTCPVIDKQISTVKEAFAYFVDNLLEEVCPVLYDALPLSARAELRTRYAAVLYDDIERVFEETRASNEDMRKEAERQVASAKEDAEHYRALYNETLERVDMLEDRIREYEAAEHS